MHTPKYNDTLVAIQRNGPGDYQVLELPQRSVQTTRSRQMGSQSDCLDHIEQTWTEGHYQHVEPQDLAEEQSARERLPFNLTW